MSFLKLDTLPPVSSVNPRTERCLEPRNLELRQAVDFTVKCPSPAGRETSASSIRYPISYSHAATVNMPHI